MNRIEYLKEQITRAERLAGNAFDKLTMERLQAFTTECRTELALLKDREKQQRVSCPVTTRARSASRIAFWEG
jgi:hypothetical protein